MTDLETRLRADGRSWQARVDQGQLQQGLLDHPARPTGRSRTAWLAPAVAATVLVGAAVAISVTLGRDGQQRSLSSAAPGSSSSPAQCRTDGLVITRLPAGAAPTHDGPAAQRVAQGQGPTQVQAVYPALVTDPLVGKLAIASEPAPRIMWVIGGTMQYHEQSSTVLSHGGPASVPDGTVRQVLALVDDASMRFAGAFDCGPAS